MCVCGGGGEGLPNTRNMWSPTIPLLASDLLLELDLKRSKTWQELEMKLNFESLTDFIVPQSCPYLFSFLTDFDKINLLSLLRERMVYPLTSAG